MSTWPNFFIIGAPRSDSTSLYHYVIQHPDIFMSRVKEPGYFSCLTRELDPTDFFDRYTIKKSVADQGDYLALFAGAGDAKVVGEASIVYLSVDGTAERICERVPEARMVAILRNPVERAYTSFMGSRRDGRESCADFREVLEDRSDARRAQWRPYSYLESGLYYRNLTRYLRHFERHQIHLSLFDDLRIDAGAVAREIFTFLEVDNEFVPERSRTYNATGMPRLPIARFIWKVSQPAREMVRPFLPERIRRQALVLMGGEKPPLDRALHAELLDFFRDDILALESLVECDLSHWLQVPGE